MNDVKVLKEKRLESRSMSRGKDDGKIAGKYKCNSKSNFDFTFFVSICDLLIESKFEGCFLKQSYQFLSIIMPISELKGGN